MLTLIRPVAPPSSTTHAESQRGVPSWRVPAIAGAFAAVLGVLYLLAPPTGEDLSAQLFRASFAGSHPLTPVDLNWFGGTTTFGYSLWAPLVMAWAGVRLSGAICSVIATVQTTVLLRRGGAARPLVGGLLAALAQAVNLVAGRTSFALGMVCGLGALLLLARRNADAEAGVASDKRRWVAVIGLALLCGGASPVAALLLWVCAAALALTGSVRRGIVLFVASLAPVLLGSMLFGEGGYESFTAKSLVYGLVATAVVALVVSKPIVRVGALVGLAMLLLSYFVATPVGDNSLRLSLLFAVPVVGAFVTWRPWLALCAVLLTAFPQQAGARYSFTHGPSEHPAYYAPLLNEIHSLGPVTGRVEIPETLAHWDSWYLGRSLPLARGWLRQLDLRLNDRTLFSAEFSASRYETFLHAEAVQYVALPDADVTASGRQEIDGVHRGLPYLHRVWGDEHWSLYTVRDAVPIVAAPGRLVAHSAARLVIDAPANSTVDVSMRWIRWLTTSSGCIAPAADGSTQQEAVQLRTTAAGRYVISSSLDASGHCSGQTS